MSAQEEVEVCENCGQPLSGGRCMRCDKLDKERKSIYGVDN